jgi:hypothetical protein
MLFRAMIAAALLSSAMGVAAAVPAAASAQEQGPDLAGLWRFDMTSPKGVTTLGAMTVLKNKDSGAYEGRLITNGGVHGLPIRFLHLQSSQMTMEVESEHGLIVFKGELAPSGQGFSGMTIYHDGRPFRMTGVKQQALFPSPQSTATR